MKEYCNNNACITKYGMFCNKHLKYTKNEEDLLNDYNMKKYNTKRNHLRKNSVTRKHRGGKKRVEKVRVVFSRQYTNPDIFSMVRVEKGPQSHETDSQGEYLVNFVSETAKDFEEECFTPVF